MRIFFFPFFVSFILLQLCGAEYTVQGGNRPVFSIWKTDGFSNTPRIQASALDHIEKIVKNRTVKVITIVGDYHSGKSSLNNALVNAGKNVFLVAADLPPQTQGFEAVVLVDDDDASKPAILLIDTPGTSATDFTPGLQASYFGASYLMSSTLVFNTMRRVGSRNDIDFLADRLRYVLSTNATIPETLQPPPGTAPCSLVWLIQNVDVQATHTSESAQINVFIDDHKSRRYELQQVFPGGIDPFTLPTPGSPDFLKRFDADSTQWTEEYKTKMNKLRAILFHQPLKGYSAQRVWKNFKDWRLRLEISFDDKIAAILQGMVNEVQISQKEVVQKMLLNDAVSRAIDQFIEAGSTIALTNMASYKSQLSSLRNAAKQYVRSRSIAVPEAVINQVIESQVEGSLRHHTQKFELDMEAKIEQKWLKEQGAASEEYRKLLESKFVIPFDDSEGINDKDTRENVAGPFLRKLVGDLAEDAEQYRTFQKLLLSAADTIKRQWSRENTEAISKLCNMHGNKVDKAIESASVKLTNGHDTNAPPSETLEKKNARVELSKAADAVINDEITFKDLPWIKKSSHWKESVVNYAANRKSYHLDRISDVQDRRVGKLAKEKEISAKRAFDAEMGGIREEKVPNHEKILVMAASTARLNAMKLFNDALGVFVRYKAVTPIVDGISKYMEGKQKELLEDNVDAWQKLFNGPAFEAKRDLRDHADKCQAMSYEAFMMTFECFKPSSLLGLPSMEGVARGLLKDRIRKSIEESRKNKTPAGGGKRQVTVSDIPPDLLAQVIDGEIEKMSATIKRNMGTTNTIVGLTLLLLFAVTAALLSGNHLPREYSEPPNVMMAVASFIFVVVGVVYV